MNTNISLRAVGHASGFLLTIFFTLCVIFDLIFPSYAMHSAWHILLPGFEWISFGSYLLGAIETYLYGWLFALIWVPLYSFFANKPINN